MFDRPRRAVRVAPLVLVIALVAYAAVVVAMVTAPSVASAAAIGDTSNNTPWTLPSMPPKCSASQISSGNVSTCLITDWGKIAEKGWGTPPFPYETVGGELAAGWKWLGWSYNGSPALADWEASMSSNGNKVGRLRVDQIKAPPAAHVLFMGFLAEIQYAGYHINDAIAYNYRCTSNSRKDCASLDTNSLSYHSYGLALDINVSANPEIRYYPDSTQGILTACAMPMKTNIPQWVVQTAQRWGLLWGGYGWSGGCASPKASKTSVIRDPMHFEFRGSVDDAIAIARFNGVGRPVSADPSPVNLRSVERVHGSTRFTTASATAEFWTQADTVFLATGSNFPDSLSAGVSAARVDAPVLLVTADSVPAPTRDQLVRLAPRTVIVAGGPAVISDEVVATVEEITNAEVIRLFGRTRYETAELLTRVSWYHSSAKVAWMASGRDFQDPLIASAAAAVYGQPFVLVDGQRDLTDNVRDLLRDLGVTQLNLVAAPGAFSDEALADLRSTMNVVVYGASDPAERSASVWGDHDRSEQVMLATSLNFPDALTAVPYATRTDGTPLMLVPGRCVPKSTYQAINRLDAVDITLFGGPAALDVAVESLTTC